MIWWTQNNNKTKKWNGNSSKGEKKRREWFIEPAPKIFTCEEKAATINSINPEINLVLLIFFFFFFLQWLKWLKLLLLFPAVQDFNFFANVKGRLFWAAFAFSIVYLIIKQRKTLTVLLGKVSFTTQVDWFSCIFIFKISNAFTNITKTVLSGQKSLFFVYAMPYSYFRHKCDAMK